MSRGKNQAVIDYEFTNVAAGTATTTVMSVPSTNQAGYGILHTLTINTKGSASNTLTVYDSTTGAGTKIATIDTTSQIGTLFFDCACVNGITVVSATGTGADYTVTWSR